MAAVLIFLIPIRTGEGKTEIVKHIHGAVSRVFAAVQKVVIGSSYQIKSGILNGFCPGIRESDVKDLPVIVVSDGVERRISDERPFEDTDGKVGRGDLVLRIFETVMEIISAGGLFIATLDLVFEKDQIT